MANDGDHVVVVAAGDDGYRAECSCGWASEWFDGDNEADWEAEDHRQVAILETTRRRRGFERFMTDLLDVQDDLLAASMWLAEHWSADLPTPGWYSNGNDRDRTWPAFTVSIYCQTGAELARAADLLDVEAVDDPAPNRNGDRYRRATRHFGRVEVEAYTALPVTEVAA